MDKEIPLKERRRRKMIVYGRIALALAIAVGAVIWYSGFTRRTVRLSALKIAEVSEGTIETTVSASGKVVPGREELIISPISSRVLAVYKSAGDEVEEGEPLMLLDLKSATADLQGMLDEATMKEEQMEIARTNAATALSNLEMRLAVKEMSVEQLRVELQNERYLDSIGSGTGDNVRRAENAWRTGQMELEQLRQELAAQRQAKGADLRMKQIEMGIFNRRLNEKRRTLVDAEIRAPRRGVVTEITRELGQNIGAGSKVAIISDLDHYKITGEIADSHGDRVATGSRVVLRIGRAEIEGAIAEMSPVSRNGVLSFTVKPDNDADSCLRSGVRAEIYVKTNVIPNAVRIPNGPYYTSGPGRYELFVLNPEGTEIEKRPVTLGQANYEYVEVVSGLSPGEQVVVGDMSSYKKYDSLKIKN